MPSSRAYISYILILLDFLLFSISNTQAKALNTIASYNENLIETSSLQTHKELNAPENNAINSHPDSINKVQHMHNLLTGSVDKALTKCAKVKNIIQSNNPLKLYEVSFLEPLELAMNMSNKLSAENFNAFTNIFLVAHDLQKSILNIPSPFLELSKQPRDDISIISRYYTDRNFIIDNYIQNITEKLTHHYKTSAKICSAAIEVSISDIFDNIYTNLFKDVEILSWPMNKFVLQIRMAAEIAKIQMEKNFKSVMNLLVSTSEASSNLSMLINKDLVHYLQKQDYEIKLFILDTKPKNKGFPFQIFNSNSRQNLNSYGAAAVFINHLRADLDDFIEDQKTKITLILKKNTLGADQLAQIFTTEKANEI